MKAVSGAALAAVRFRVQKASFHAKMTFRSSVEAMPGMAIGVRTEVVLHFRPVCSQLKMDQGFISGC